MRYHFRRINILLLSSYWLLSQSSLATTSSNLLSKKSANKLSDEPYEREEAKKDDEGRNEEGQTDNEEDLSYETYRSRSRWSLMADGVGFLNGLTLTGLTIASYLNKNLLLEGSVISGDHYGMFGGDGTKQTITIAEGRLRQFLGDTFNVSAALGWKSHQIASTPSLRTSLGYEQIDGISATGSGIVGGLSIGNQVQRDRVTLGCDWVGYYRVITMLDHNEAAVSSDDPLAATKADYISGFREKIKGDSLFLFRVHLGMVF